MTRSDPRRRVPHLGPFVAIVAAAGFLLLSTGAPEAAVEAPAIDPAAVAPAVQLSKAFAMIAAHVMPSVVSVYSERMDHFPHKGGSFPFGNDFFRHFLEPPGGPESQDHGFSFPESGMGSGMILDQDGHILTSFHVIKGEEQLYVQLADKISYEAEIVGTDADSDVAIIKMKGNFPAKLPAVTLGDSDAAKVGDLVIAIGAPFGLQQTVTEGIISATGRANVGLSDYENFIQTDAPINPGNSGGPLVNMKGEVIGMNSAIATNGASQFAGVGFSIPSSVIKTMLPTLMKGQRVVRGELGVAIQALTPALAKSFGLSQAQGALVAQVSNDSPAARAGLKVGDVIVRYNGKPVRDVDELRDMVAATQPGTSLKIGIIRDKRLQTLTAVIGRRGEHTAASAATPSPSNGATILSNLGLEVQTLTLALAQQLGIEAKGGVVIDSVSDGSLAALAGLQEGGRHPGG